MTKVSVTSGEMKDNALYLQRIRSLKTELNLCSFFPKLGIRILIAS